MAAPRMRPRFSFQVPVGRSIWLRALGRVLEDDPGECRGQIFKKHAVVEVRSEARRFWSPYLSIEVEDEPDGSAIRGRFSPHPHVWTLFMAIYLLLGILAISGLVFGIVQHTLGRSPWGFVVLPLAVGMFAFVYGATLIGQGLGAEQMYVMRSLVDRATESAVGVVGGDAR